MTFIFLPVLNIIFSPSLCLHLLSYHLYPYHSWFSPSSFHICYHLSSYPVTFILSQHMTQPLHPISLHNIHHCVPIIFCN
uniref:Uncharacterized protein n=1 Tax=Octopus bimaculoides TaxID=37653 RepID=A0A0L8GAW1_OCTBM